MILLFLYIFFFLLFATQMKLALSLHNAFEKRKWKNRNRNRNRKIRFIIKHFLVAFFRILFADADFCCGMDTPAMAKNVSGWLPGRAQNRGAFWFFQNWNSIKFLYICCCLFEFIQYNFHSIVFFLICLVLVLLHV